MNKKGSLGINFQFMYSISWTQIIGMQTLLWMIHLVLCIDSTWNKYGLKLCPNMQGKQNSSLKSK